MKKILVAFAMLLTLLFCGCQANKHTNTSDYGENISKTQEIAVISSNTSEVVKTITDAKDIENFVFALHLDQWKLKTLPDGASEIGSFGLSQEETIKWGQADTDGTLHDIATITLYDGAYIRFEMGEFNMTFAVSEDTADYLNGYFK